MLDNLINQIIDNFDWAYMLSVNVLTYIIIKIIDYLNKEKEVSIIIKRIVLFSSIIILGITYYFISDIDKKILLNSAILAPVAWDFVFRPIIKQLGLGYHNDNHGDFNKNHSDTELDNN